MTKISFIGPSLSLFSKTIVATVAVALLTACGGGGGDSGSTPTSSGSPIISSGNTLAIAVDSGPNNSSFNMPFTTVTVCVPGTTTCQTVDHVLVDTGSYGLRLLSSVVGVNVSLPAVHNAANAPVAECTHFVSGYTWGSVRRADVKLADEIASNLPVQIVSDPSSLYSNVPTQCSNVGANMGSVAGMGANGILGVGLFNQDCLLCSTSTSPNVYFSCTASGCSSTLLPLTSQVANPVPAFAVDNNGIMMSLPSVGANGAGTLYGTLNFGIGTQSNNQIGSTTTYTANAQGNFITTYKGTKYSSSFIDSGSNGLFFPDASISQCSGVNSGFYCPPSTLSLSAINASATGLPSGTVNFTIDNAQSISVGDDAANIGGPLALSNTFDWGLPFFFGRTVFVAINGLSTPSGKGPYWAY